HLDHGAVPESEGAGSVLERAPRGRREATGVRVADRPLRTQVADRARGDGDDDAGPEPGAVEAGDGRDDDDGEVRHRGTEEGLARVWGLSVAPRAVPTQGVERRTDALA